MVTPLVLPGKSPLPARRQAPAPPPVGGLSDNEARKVERALSAFQTWRRDRGEMLPSDVWAGPAPSSATVQDYLLALKAKSKDWQRNSKRGLFLYLTYHGLAPLADMVHPRRRRGHRAAIADIGGATV